MKFNIPKIIRPLDLGTYEPEMEGVTVHVWVNPTRDMLNESVDIQLELAQIINQVNNPNETNIQEIVDGRFNVAMKRQYEWHSKILSQKTDEETHLSADDLEELADQDLALWQFMRTAINAMIGDHREGVKKD